MVTGPQGLGVAVNSVSAPKYHLFCPSVYTCELHVLVSALNDGYISALIAGTRGGGGTGGLLSKSAFGGEFIIVSRGDG